MAEDNQVNRKLAERLFKRHGYEIDFAEDGHEAVEKATSQAYRIILMDIEMPGRNGLEAAQAIRAEMGEQTPPIVALTAHTMEGQREQFLAQGMDAYLSKPIKMEAFEEILAQQSQGNS
jgi:CheY-like chemotaxis protein